MEKILQNEELLEKLANVETVEELEKILAENNIPLEEGVTAQQVLDALKGAESGELSEDDLGDVAGGMIITPAILAGAMALGIGIAKYIKYYYKKNKKK